MSQTPSTFQTREFTGKLIVHFDLCHMSGCDVAFAVSDHKLNQKLGILKLFVICGARKRAHEIIALSEGAKQLFSTLSEWYRKHTYRSKDTLETGVTVTFIQRSDRIPKIIVSNTVATTNLVILGIYGGGYRGGVYIEPSNNVAVLLQVGAAQAWSSAIAVLAWIPPNEYLIIRRTGRLYGDHEKMVLVNRNGQVVYLPFEEFQALEE